MQEIKEKLSAILSKILATEVKLGDFTAPPQIEMGDLAFPCFDFAKKSRKAPAAVAGELATSVLGQPELKGMVKEVKAMGPYLNFFFVDEYFNQVVLTSKPEKKKERQKLMIEYSQPNTHKEFHVGHLRNACLGSALVNIFRYLGYKITSATYVNDVGIHVAKCLWALQKFHAEEKMPENKGQYLGVIYADAARKLEENEEYKKEVSALLHNLESGEKKTRKIWKETRDWSLAEFREIYKILDIKFDKWFFESDVLDRGKKIVQEFLAQGIAEKSEGAIIIDLKKYNLDVLLVLKTDGNALYSTSDLALAYEKFKSGVDTSIYVVDNRQTMYFKQLFKTLELAGFKKNMIHVPYEFVTLPTGALSSRKGNIISFENFYEEIIKEAESETVARHQDWPKNKIKEVAQNIALSAIKFNMLKYDNNSVIVFEIKKALSFDGDTGPYLLYTVARINSILKKGKREKVKGERFNFGNLVEKSEKELIREIARFDEIVELAKQEYAPAKICSYLLSLAQKFNNFYHYCPVLKAEDSLRAARFQLVVKTKEKLEVGLSLLNIEPVEEM